MSIITQPTSKEREEKSAYIRELLEGKEYHPRMLDAALIYYHSGIPLDQAQQYLTTLKEKLKLRGHDFLGDAVNVQVG